MQAQPLPPTGGTFSNPATEALRSPDDLVKVAALRKKLLKEKAAIDAKLKSGVAEQLDAIRDGLRKLQSTRQSVQAMRDNMAGIDKMGKDMTSEMMDFGKISQVSMVHRHFAETEVMVNNLRDMYTKIDAVEALLAEDEDDPAGPNPNLLRVHFELMQLEAFRNQTLHQAKRATADSRATLDRYFERLNSLIARFDAHICELARHVLDIVRAGNPSVIVRLLKIAEVEGKEDEKAVAMRLVMKANTDSAAKFRSMQAHARTIKHVRHKILDNIKSSISELFQAAVEANEGNPAAFVDTLGWYYEDLMQIEADVVPCFPPDYNIHATYVKTYHTALDATLRKIVADAPEASVLLSLHAWVKQYPKNMKELEVPPEWLAPPLLGGREQELIEDYVKLIVRKLDEWTFNLMRDETREFVERHQPPEIDADGLWGTQGAVILFQMINQQADLAADSGQGAVLARVVSESNRVMRSVQAEWLALIDAEAKKQMERPDDVPGGLGEYVIALANDQIKSADYTEALLQRLEPLVSEKYRVVISDKLNNAMDGFLDVAKKCIQTLVNIIFHDLKPATKALFSPQWYTDGLVTQITETIRDYLGDYSQHLNTFLLDLLVDNLIDDFLIAYLTGLRRCSKLKIPQALDQIRTDIGEAFSLFASLKPEEEITATFDVLDKVLSILSASDSMLYLDFFSFAKQHGPCLPFVTALIKARDDFDRKTSKEVLDTLQRKAAEENFPQPEVPTIMSRIPAK